MTLSPDLNQRVVASYSDQDGSTASGGDHGFRDAEAGVPESTTSFGKSLESSVSYNQADLVMGKTRSEWAKSLIPLPYIISWYFFSLTLSTYNKTLFGASNWNFPFPLFTSAIHMVAQFCLSWLCLTFLWPELKPVSYPDPINYLTRVVPCGFATGLDIGLSNSSLQTISLSFYTMVKSSSPIFVLLFAFLFRLETPTWELTGIILTICFGVVLMVVDTPNFEWIGFIEVQTATVLSGFRWSITQILLERKSLGMSNPLATSLFLSPIMAASLFITSAIVEKSIFDSSYFASAGKALIMTGLMLIGAVLAFLMVMSEFKLISVSSVLTFSVAGIFKEILTIAMSAVVFGEQPFSLTKVSGLILSIGGIVAFNYVRMASGHSYGASNEEVVVDEPEGIVDSPDRPASRIIRSRTPSPSRKPLKKKVSGNMATALFGGYSAPTATSYSKLVDAEDSEDDVSQFGEDSIMLKPMLSFLTPKRTSPAPTSQNASPQVSLSASSSPKPPAESPRLI